MKILNNKYSKYFWAILLIGLTAITPACSRQNCAFKNGGYIYNYKAPDKGPQNKYAEGLEIAFSGENAEK